MRPALEPPTGNEIHVWRIELGPDRDAAAPALGRILAGYLGRARPPALATDPAGKPRLAVEPERLSFNLSHSGGLALVAIAPGGVEVGVDVERLKERRRLARIAARWLSPAAAVAVAEAPPGDREQLFYTAWTRHEARVKCVGGGLGGPPPGDEICAWSLDVDAGYAAAVALASPSEPRIVFKDAACRR